MVRKNKKWFLIIFLILLVSIGFAILTANLNINAALSFEQNKWDVHFENVEVSLSTVSNPVVNILNDTTIKMSGEFSRPGDYLEFYVGINNAGTLDAEVKDISNNLSDSLLAYIKISYIDVDSDKEFSKGQLLYMGQVKRIKVRIEYLDSVDDFIPNTDLELLLTFSFIHSKNNKNEVWDYGYSNTEQVFYPPFTGKYRIELWGAAGGNYEIADSRGAYTAGTIELKRKEKIYLYVGAAGNNATWYGTRNYNEFNAGVNTYGQGNYYNVRYFGNGGGATDVRLVDGNWNDFDSLKSRIMVAGAGGGSYVTYENPNIVFRNGGAAGGLVGYDGTDNNHSQGTGGLGGTQTAGGYAICREGQSQCTSAYGLGQYGFGGFGFGGIFTSWPSQSGGSGYYGGGSSMHVESGGGGSSYISGHVGCIAIKDTSTKDNIIPSTDSIHYSGRVFTDTLMIDGKGFKWTTVKEETATGMPVIYGTGTMMGNNGDGHVRITYLG